MTLSEILKVWLRHAKRLLRDPLTTIALRKRFPTCHFYDGASVDGSSTLGGYNVIFQGAIVFNSSLGRHTYVQRNSSILNSRVGKFCSIASGVNIGLGRHPIEQVSTHPAFYSATQPLAKTYSKSDTYNPFKPIEIGNDVWIGQGAFLMDGICVGNGAVIAANAVVTKNVPAYAIVAGVPAALIKYRFDEQTVCRLEALQWWDKCEDWLAKHCSAFSEPARLFDALNRDSNTAKGNEMP